MIFNICAIIIFVCAILGTLSTQLLSFCGPIAIVSALVMIVDNFKKTKGN